MALKLPSQVPLRKLRVVPSAFVSYAHEDREFVLSLVEHLRGQGLEITYDQIALEIGDSLIRRISEAILEGDILHLARMLDGLRGEGVAPPLVLWAIAEEIRTIGRVLDGIQAGRTPPQLWREARVWGNSHQQLMQQHGRRFTREQVEAALRHAARADRMAKGLIRGDVWDELLQLALRFASSAPASPAQKRGKMPAASRAAEQGQQGLF